MSEVIGACLGASSISFVRIKREDHKQVTIEDVLTIPHNGDPRKAFKENLIQFSIMNKSTPSDKLGHNHTTIQSFNHIPVVVTGRKFRKLVKFTNISEPEASEYAFAFINKDKENYSAVASLGGETFMVYALDEEGKISDVITKNQCASGTGEFFLQQIKRMDLGIDEVVNLAADAEPFKVSGRCSVFCKSDCTHALNKGIKKSEVAAGLSSMMAEKAEELLRRSAPGRCWSSAALQKTT